MIISNFTYKGFREDFIIKSDMKRLQQVLLNLYSNAIKFTEKHGMIQVKVSQIKEGNKPMILIEVKDNGIGIKYKD